MYNKHHPVIVKSYWTKNCFVIDTGYCHVATHPAVLTNLERAVKQRTVAQQPRHVQLQVLCACHAVQQVHCHVIRQQRPFRDVISQNCADNTRL